VNGKADPASPATADFPGWVDSHCHLDFPEFDGKMDELRTEMRANGVTHALCISVNLAGFPKVLALAEAYDNFFATVGVHPDHEDRTELDPARLVELARHPRIVAIGETGLDYYRLSGDLAWQRERFRAHIRAARECGKPLVIHTRQAAEDTLTVMREEGAAEVGGVMHCFTESRAMAEAVIALGFHISFSGIVTFKNAGALKDVARWVPLERLLVETDSPYLAPVPHRGKTNRPGLVRFVAEEVARLRGISFEELARATTGNFFSLFDTAKRGRT
jgi:TatD DNase family protein